MGLLFCVDCETTGLDPSTSGIIDLAAVAIRDGQVVDRFSSLVFPGRENLQAEHLEVIARTSGIPVEDLLKLSTPEVPVARTAFVRWLLGVAGVPDTDPRVLGHEGVPRVPIRLTSYNLNFDSAFLGAAPWELGWHLSALGHAELQWAPCVMLAVSEDLGKQGRIPRSTRGPGYRWLKLPHACREYGLPFEETHRALSDCEAAAQLAIVLGVE